MARRQFLTQKELQKIMDEASDDEYMDSVAFDENTQVIYIPPEKVDCISDEEFFDDDDLMTDYAPNLETAGEIEVQFESANHDFSAPEMLDLESVPDITSNVSKDEEYSTLESFGEPKWKKTKRVGFNFESPNEDNVQPLKNRIVEEMGGKTPLELFFQYFDDEVINLIVDNTNIYAAQHNTLLSVNKEQICRFLGILILSGYHTLPQMTLYWSTKSDMGVPIVQQSMARNKFLLIKQHLHLVDNAKIDSTDRFAKVRPLINLLNNKYKQFGIFATNLSIDEQMVPYFGRHNCKMFIRGKPIRFGFKFWCMCSDDGYMYEAIPYAGISTPYNKRVGLGASVVLELLKSVEVPENHAVYFDNFFSSYYLFCLLNQKQFRATGTVRSNRLKGADPHLATAKVSKMKGKQKLMKHEYDCVFDANNKLFVSRWHDNSEVTIISNFVGASPERIVLRYSSQEKTRISTPQPNLINKYNQHMGGVDLHDNGVANYRIAVRSKKWWWPLWTNCINSTIVNAWKIHCIISRSENTRPMSQLEFKSEIARGLLLYEVNGEDLLSEEDFCAERPNKMPRLDVSKHVIWKSPNSKRKRCGKCHSQTIYECKKCNISLHPKCFDEYHA